MPIQQVHGNVIPYQSGGVTATGLGSGSVVSTTSSYTFTNAITTSATGVICVVGYVSRGALNRNVSSITIGGTTATAIGGTSGIDGDVEIGYLEKTAGTYTIVVNASSTAHRAGWTAYLIEGYGSSTAGGSNSSYAGSATSRTATLTSVTAGAACIWGAFTMDTNNMTWSGAPTEDYEELPSGYRFGSASVTDVASGNQTGTATWTFNSNCGIVGAWWV